MLRKFKVLFIALVAIVVAGGSYAFAAANTVADSAAGYKDSVVSGYAVTNVVYDLNATDPTLVDNITFDVAPTTGSAVAKLVEVQTATAGDWMICGLADGTAPVINVTCTYTNPTLELTAVTALNVVASSTLDPAP